MAQHDDFSDVQTRHYEAMARLGAEATGPSLPAIANPMHQGLDALISPALWDGRRVLVKTFHDGINLPHGFTGAHEAAQAAAQIKVSPAIVGIEVATRTLVFEDLGEGWRPAGLPDMLNPQQLSEMLRLKKRFHTEAPLSGTLAPADEFEKLRKLVAVRPELTMPVTLRMGLTELADWVERISGALADSPAELGACHGENALSNVMIGPEGAIRLVDFDRATMGDIWRDLGALALEICADDIDRSAFIEAYTSAPARPDQMARLKLYGLLDDVIWALHLMLGETEQDRQGPELYKYAANRLVRFRTHLSQFDMAKLLQEV